MNNENDVKDQPADAPELNRLNGVAFQVIASATYTDPTL